MNFENGRISTNESLVIGSNGIFSRQKSLTSTYTVHTKFHANRTSFLWMDPHTERPALLGRSKKDMTYYYKFIQILLLIVTTHVAILPLLFSCSPYFVFLHFCIFYHCYISCSCLHSTEMK